MTIYQCQGDFEHILCGVYEAWMSRKGHENVALGLEEEEFQPSFLDEYVQVAYDEEKFQKVFGAIRSKLSWEVLDWVYRACLSEDSSRPDKVYRFLVTAFSIGPGVVRQIQLPSVHELFQLVRFVGNESHLITEFLRFSQTEGGVLVSRIGPKNNVLPLISGHFADRLPEENWVIWDENRDLASIHPAGKGWYLSQLNREEAAQIRSMEGKGLRLIQEDYEGLWKAFCASTAIMERKNPRCQRTHLPLRYRPYMTEFQ